jgi:hypothetical protein
MAYRKPKEIRQLNQALKIAQATLVNWVKTPEGMKGTAWVHAEQGVIAAAATAARAGYRGVVLDIFIMSGYSKVPDSLSGHWRVMIWNAKVAMRPNKQ